MSNWGQKGSACGKTESTFIMTEQLLIAVTLLSLYLVIVRQLRFQRCHAIQSRFQSSRPLSSMTVKEAHQIVRELRELEFPYTLHNAMKISLLKVCSIYIQSF